MCALEARRQIPQYIFSLSFFFFLTILTEEKKKWNIFCIFINISPGPKERDDFRCGKISIY